MDNYFIDHNRIVFSKSFRRMVHKTQIYSFNRGDHYRSRMTHTLEVAEIAENISRLLQCNSELTNCIALAHDIGHTPYGHQGERTLNEILHGNDNLGGILENKIEKDAYGFKHSIYGAIYLQQYENDNDYSHIADYTKDTDITIKKGLDIHWKIIDGICKHTHNISKSFFFDNTYNDIFKHSFITKHFKKEDYIEINNALTLEGQIVAIADEIAQRQHDLDDGLKTAIDSFYLKELKSTLRNICKTNVQRNNPRDIYHRVNTIYTNEIDSYLGKDKKTVEKVIEKEKDMIETYATEDYYKKIYENNKRLFTSLSNQTKSNNNKFAFIYEIRRYLITDVVEHTKVVQKMLSSKKEEKSKEKTNELELTDIDGETLYFGNVVSFSRYGALVNHFLEKYINNLIIRSNYVCKDDGRAAYEIRQLFKAYYSNIKQLSSSTLDMIFKKISKIKQIEKYKLHVYSKDADDIEIDFVDIVFLPRHREIGIYNTDSKMFDFLQKILLSDNYGKDVKYKIICPEGCTDVGLIEEIRKIFIIEIAFYIGSMTDNYAFNEYKKLYLCE